MLVMRSSEVGRCVTVSPGHALWEGFASKSEESVVSNYTFLLTPLLLTDGVTDTALEVESSQSAAWLAGH